MYVFPTEAGREAVLSGRYQITPVKVGGAHVGEGYLVPPGDIRACLCIPIPQRLLDQFPYTTEVSTSAKGDAACEIVSAMMAEGLLPIGLTVEDVPPGHALQIAGADIIATCNHRVQVKCDYVGGDREGGSGFLFLQVRERNPLKRY